MAAISTINKFNKVSEIQYGFQTLKAVQFPNISIFRPILNSQKCRFQTFTTYCSNYRVCQIKPGVGVDVWLPESDSVNEPVELLVPVHVLGGAKGVGHTLDTVNDGTGKVVGGVNLKTRKLISSVRTL